MPTHRNGAKRRPTGSVSCSAAGTATRTRPRAFEQRGTDRTGLGLGLSLSRRGVEANGGALSVRDLPGTGCVFTVDLPRLPPAAV